MKMNHWTKASIAFFLPLSVLLFVPTPHTTGKIHIPGNLDVIGMIQRIHSNNDSINSVNQKIVGNMTQISQLADITGQIGENLHTLKQGITTQDSSLSNLDTLSQKEIDLSNGLHGLAQNLSSDLSKISQSSSSQNRSIQQMIDTSRQLGNIANQIAQVNSTITGKLNTARDKTKQVNSSMPGL